MLEQIVLGGVVFCASLAAAVAGLLLVHLVARRPRRASPALLPLPEDEAAFLFDDEALVDASDAGRALLAQLPPGPTPWARFAAWAGPRFPGFLAEIGHLAERGRLRLPAEAPSDLTLLAEWREGLARLVVQDARAEGRSVPVDRLSLAAAEEELALLRRLLEGAPLPIWRESSAGAVTWANTAYLRLASGRDAAAGVLTWPLPRLFDPPPEAGPAAPPAATPQRRALAQGAGPPRWFDCTTVPEPDGSRLCFAQPADAAARAETAMRDLMTTLTRTFAHLPVGLAVFDRQRRLQLFNPALADLTTLPPEFLIARPGFDEFFDALRTRRMLPEPRDYRAWRNGLVEMERAAARGHYQETWSLATGQTYRVTGRPHPEGAVAFLIEDISAEVSLTRRFRAEIETGQAVLDSLPEAVAVFSPAGVLVMANDAYALLWGQAPDTGLGDLGVGDALRQWKSLAHPSPHWSTLRALIGAGGPRRAWTGALQLRDGRHLLCRLEPLAGGATLVGFRDAAAAAQAAPLVEAGLPGVGGSAA